MKIFGYTIAKGSSVKLKAPVAVSLKNRSARVRNVIRKQIKRDVSYQIQDINTAITLAKNAATPDRAKLHRIYDYILKDAHLKSQKRNAIYEVLSEPWLLYRNGTPDEKATEVFQKKWFSAVIRAILESEMHGYSVIEVDEMNPSEGSIGVVILIDREYVSIENQWILLDGTVNGDYLPYAEVMDDLGIVEFGNRDDFGTLLECSYNIVWKYYSRNDWSRGSEKFGMPILSIEADTNNDDELDALETRAANFGADGYIVTQAGDTVTMIERQGQRMHDIWLDNIKYCDEQVSKVINGQTSSSDPKAFVGAAQVQERTMQTFTLARLQNIVDEMNENFLPFLVRKGFAIDGLKMDYPVLIRERDKRKNGIQVQTDPKDQPGADPKKPEPK